MRLNLGHRADDRVAHLTHTTLVVEALCGVVVEHDGEPDLAVICEECLELALAATEPTAEAQPTAPLPLAA